MMQWLYQKKTSNMIYPGKETFKQSNETFQTWMMKIKAIRGLQTKPE